MSTPRKTRVGKGDRDGISKLDVWAAKKRQEGKRWLYRVWDARLRTYIRKAFATETEGDSWAEDERSRIRNEESAGPARAALLDRVAEAYLEELNLREPAPHPTTLRNIELVVEGLRKSGAVNLKGDGFRARVAHYLRNMPVTKSKAASGKLAASTKNRNLIHVRSLVNYAIDRGWLRTNPIADLDPFKDADAPREVFTLAELRRVAALNRRTDPLWLWVMLLLYTGLRRAESFALRWEDFDWEGRLVRVRKGKGNKARVVPMQDELHDLLAPLGGPEAKTPRVGQFNAALAKTDKGAWAAFRRLLGLAKVDPERGTDPTTDMPLRLSPHSARHTYAALQLATGTDAMLLRMSMGHSEDEMTEHYARQVASFKRQVEQEGWKRGQFRLMVPSAAKSA